MTLLFFFSYQGIFLLVMNKNPAPALSTEPKPQKIWSEDKAYIEGRKRVDIELERMIQKLDREKIANELSAQKTEEEFNRIRLERIKTEGKNSDSNESNRHPEKKQITCPCCGHNFLITK